MKRNLLLLIFGISILILIPCTKLEAASGITSDVSSLDFGNQANGTISQSQTVTLTNEFNGNGVIGAILLAGEDPLQYIILDDFCSGMVLANQESCSLSVAFGPSFEFPDEEGSSQADLIINFQDPPALSIPLDGNILLPNIESSTTSLDFGREVAGKLSDPITVTLSNTGEADLQIGTARTSNGDTVDFAPSLDECTFQTLAPGESCVLDLNMRPTDLGDRFAEFTVESNDPDEPLLTISLSGEGTGSGGCHLGAPIQPGSSLGVWFLFLGIPWLRFRRK